MLHALTMSMGLEWVEATPDNEGNNDEERMHMAPDPCRYVLGLAATAPAGQEFFYNTGALTLLSAMIRKATGRTLDEFARATLFEPMGITGVEWIRVEGDTDAGGGLRLRPRDMAKIGQLVLAGGRWNDRQVVSATAREDELADFRHVAWSQAQSPSGIGIPLDPNPRATGDAHRLEQRSAGKFVEGASGSLADYG